MNTSIFRRLAALALTLAFALSFCACSDLADAALSEAADAVRACCPYQKKRYFTDFFGA